MMDPGRKQGSIQDMGEGNIGALSTNPYTAYPCIKIIKCAPGLLFHRADEISKGNILKIPGEYQVMILSVSLEYLAHN